MDFRLIILLLSPLLCESNIKIDITASNNKNVVNVRYSGIDIRTITDEDMDLFNINEDIIKDAIRLNPRYGETPSDVYFRSPTPWGDLYKRFHWKEVKTQTKVDKIRKKPIKKTTEIISTNHFYNSSNKTVRVDTGMRHQVENTISTYWSRGSEFSIGQNFDYGVNVIFAKIGGSTGLSYRETWGKTVEKTESIIIGTWSGVKVDLAPKQAITVYLQATRKVLQVEIDYILRLTGKVVMNYSRKLKGHHFYSSNMAYIMKSRNLKNFVKKTEVIEICFYSDASIKVFDDNTGLPL